MISSLTRVRKRESGSTDEGRIVLVEPKNKATVELGQRETRFWLQILSLHGYIFSSLNSILNSQFDLSVVEINRSIMHCLINVINAHIRRQRVESTQADRERTPASSPLARSRASNSQFDLSVTVIVLSTAASCTA